MGEWGYSFTILDLGTRWSFTPLPLYPRGKISRYPLYLYIWLGRPQSRSGHCGEEKNILPLPGFKPRPSSPSLYRLRYPIIFYWDVVRFWHLEEAGTLCPKRCYQSLSTTFTNYFLKIHLNVILPSPFLHSKWPFATCFFSRVLKHFIYPTPGHMCSTLYLQFQYCNNTMYNSQNSSLCNRPTLTHGTSSCLGPHMSLRMLSAIYDLPSE
jgi:hypothetical protein